jgi:hypothetical protein
MPQAKAQRQKLPNPLGLAVTALLFERPMHPYEPLSTPVEEYSQFEAALPLMPVLPPDEVLALLEAERVQHLVGGAGGEFGCSLRACGGRSPGMPSARHRRWLRRR